MSKDLAARGRLLEGFCRSGVTEELRKLFANRGSLAGWPEADPLYRIDELRNDMLGRLGRIHDLATAVGDVDALLWPGRQQDGDTTSDQYSGTKAQMRRRLLPTKATQRATVRGCLGHFERLSFLLDESPNPDLRIQHTEAKIKRYEDRLRALQAVIAEEGRRGVKADSP
jgi:hypothetical protein